MNQEYQDTTAEVVDTETGELLPAVVEQNAIANWQGIAQQAFDNKTAKTLEADIPNDKIEIRPDGMIYLPQAEYRRILNKAFGVGAWALRRLDVMKKDNTVIYDGELWANGRYIASAMGEQDYFENNKNMSWATAVESAKSDCLTRCCKDIGIAIDLWNPRFVKNWKEKNAVQVWCDNQKEKKPKQLWRKKDDPPIDQWPYKEQTGNNRNQQPPPKTPVKQPETGRTSTQSNGKVISEKQLTRMFAIANQSGVDKDTAKAVLGVFGYESSKDVLMSDYDKIINVLQVPSITLAAELENQRKAKWAMVDAELGKSVDEWLAEEKKLQSPDELEKIEQIGRKLFAELEKLESPGKPE